MSRSTSPGLYWRSRASAKSGSRSNACRNSILALSYAAGAAKGKAPVNTPAGDLKWEEYAPGVPLQIAKLWGDRTKGGEYAMLLKFPPKFEAGMHAHTADYHAISIKGQWVHTNEGGAAVEKGVGLVEVEEVGLVRRRVAVADGCDP